MLYVGLMAWLSILAPQQSQWTLFFGITLLATALVVILHKLGTLSRPLILGVAIGLRILFLPMPPSLSDDAYRYIWDGAVSADGLNPYKYRPSDPELESLQTDPIYEELNSADYYTVYPPISQLYFFAGGQFYDQDWSRSYYAIKALLVLTEILALLLLAGMAPPLMLLLYAWHPLVLIETAGQAHTESAMLFFLLLAVWSSRKQWGSLASISLAVAGWIKLYPFVLMPLLWRRFKWRGLVPGGITTVALLVPFFYPAFFSNIKSSLDLYVRYFEFNAGVYYGIKEVFLWWTGDDWSKQIGPFLRTVFLLGLPVIYYMDFKQNWPLHKSFFIIIAFFLLASTTIHPWYFLGLLMLLTLSRHVPWHWYWVATFAMGTYLLYIDGPYWSIVKAGWFGWVALGIFVHRNKPAEELQNLQRYRAQQKASHINNLMPATACGIKVLDLGAGEGYVGESLAHLWRADVKLADVINLNQTTLPHTLYDGQHLPFADNTFDVVVLYFVLHHCEHPEKVLAEALRVSNDRVVIVESVYESDWDLKQLTFLDQLANRIRSGGLMNAQEEHLTFRKAPAWKELISQYGGRVVVEHRKGEWVHKQHTFIVKKGEGEQPDRRS